MEGVFLDRTDQGRTPRFLKGELPSDADVAHVVQKISRRVIRKLRRLGYLEAGMEVPVATGYDPLLDNEPELARTLAASVMQRIAFGERAGQKVRRIGSGFGYEGERPELTGPAVPVSTAFVERSQGIASLTGLAEPSVDVSAYSAPHQSRPCH